MADTYTPNLNLKKPGYESFADIDDINGNMDKIDEAYKRLDEKSPVVDTTLTKSGQAADAKATGDALSSLKNDVRVNLLRPTLQTTTLNGVTCTNNGDGTYTLNGTASGETMFALYSDLVPYSKIKMVGCPNDGSLATFNLLCQNTRTWVTYNDIGNGIVIDIDRKIIYRISIVVQNGATVSNIVFKPMITTDIAATYGDFVSYDDSFVKGRDVIDKASIGDAWTSGTTYTVGDYCISGNRLYKCKTAHTAGSAFNAEYWDAVSVSGEILSLKTTYEFCSTIGQSTTSQLETAFQSCGKQSGVSGYSNSGAEGYYIISKTSSGDFCGGMIFSKGIAYLLKRNSETEWYMRPILPN